MTEIKQWSPLQEAIFTHIGTSTNPSLVVEAFAGCAKSTTIVEALNRHAQAFGSILILAFNKRIVLDMQNKMSTTLAHSPNITIKTLNALGHGAWARKLKRRLVLDSKKLFKITAELLNDDDLQELFSEIMALVRAARTAGLVPSNCSHVGKPTMEDSPDNWADLAEYYDIDFEPAMVHIARAILNESINQAFNGKIDFDDQIYMSTVFDGTFDKFDLVVIDEAQDLSELQHIMLKKSAKPTVKKDCTKCCPTGQGHPVDCPYCYGSGIQRLGRIIAVGDRHQAIYGFRGAHANSMDLVRAMFSADELPLSISYRCPQAVVTEAQKLVPGIQAHDSAPQGKVIKHPIDPVQLAALPYGTAILCRNNAPLFGVALQCIQQRISVKFLGRDIGEGLIKLVKKITHSTPMTIEPFLETLSEWREKEIKAKPNREGIINDKYFSIKGLADGCNTTADLIDIMEELFNKETAKITLSSIHRCKGFEWPVVYHIDPGRIPSKYAIQPWQIEQEWNLKYVAITRAQDTYVELNREALV